MDITKSKRENGGRRERQTLIKGDKVEIGKMQMLRTDIGSGMEMIKKASHCLNKCSANPANMHNCINTRLKRNLTADC